MPRISEDTIQRVAAASDVVEIIGGYLQLKRAGANWKGLCPFHHEKTPSFHVNPARQTFKCFGCGAGGTVFTFVMDYEHVDFPTAVRKLADRAGIRIAEETAGDETRRGERDRLLALHQDAATWFHENLTKKKMAAPAREYLRHRGLNSEVAARWRIGYAPESWDALGDFLRERRYSPEEMAKSGLVIAREGEKARPYDRFRNRVMFPICNDSGEVIAFSGRTLGDDPAKYVNSPETPLFTKGRVLFGLDQSKRAIIEASEAIICEGQLDTIATFEAGLRNVTASQGTAFTAQQARLLKRLADSVVVCFDSDSAGRAAVEKSLPPLLASGFAVRVARLPAGEDPDSLLRTRGAETLRAIVMAARDYFDDVFEGELPPDASPRQRAALARKLAGFVKLIDDSALREAVARRVRGRLELTEPAFTALVKAAARPDPDRGGGDVVAETETAALSEPARLICRFALDSLAVRAWIRAQPFPAKQFGPEYALVDKLAATPALAKDPPAFAAFTSGLSAEEERALVSVRVEHLASSAPADPVAATADAWRGLLRQQLGAEMTAVRARMRHPDTAADQIPALHKHILDLQERLAQL